MKIKRFTKTALLAAAGLAIVASSARAQATVTYAQGDFLLGFRASGGTGSASNILVDLGPGSNFLNSSTPVTFNLGDLGTKLVNTFTANWNVRSDVFWSVAAAGVSPDPTNTLYLTVPETVGGGEATPWSQQGTATQQGVKNKIQAEGAQYNTYTQTTGNPAVIEGQGDTNSYGSYMPGGTTANSGPAPGISYNVYNPTIEGTFANGTAGATLDLIRLVVGSGAGTDIGDFTISNNGVLTFTPDSFEAIPEPSTFVSVLLGAALLFFVLRRRQTTNL